MSLWQVLLISLLPGAGNFAGGLIAESVRVSDRSLNWALHSASGIMIAIVAIELLPRGLESLSGIWIAAAFTAGGCIYVSYNGLCKATRRRTTEEPASRECG